MIEKPNACSGRASCDRFLPGFFLREFQWLSRLPVTGELDSATLRQMAEPRCGVTDEGSQQIWAQRVNTVFTGGGVGAAGREQHRRKRSAGIVCVCVCVCVFSGMRSPCLMSVSLIMCVLQRSGHDESTLTWEGPPV